jgi:hypothetical protein
MRLQQGFAVGEMGFRIKLHGSNSEPLMSALGHSRPGPAGRRASHVRYAPKATVGHQNAIGRDGPMTDIANREYGDLPPSCSPAMRRTDCGKHHQAAESGKQAKELDSGSATPLRAATPRQFSRSQSRPTFKFVAPICMSILCASQPGRFPWSNGLDYDSDSVQYTPDFTLHAPGLGFQELLQLFEFGD